MSNQTSERKMVTFTPESLIRFKKMYQAAVEAGAETFWFESNEYVVGYARYMIQYLEMKLGRKV